MYSPQTDPKYQPEELPGSESLPENTIISPDTMRADRLPQGQHRTRKWPVLHAGAVPSIDPAKWRLTIDGLVDRPLSCSLEEFHQLPRRKVYSDFHCVTAWSRLGNLWEGVAMTRLLGEVCVQQGSQFAVVEGHDEGWTTNLPLSALLHEDVLLADRHDGEPIDDDHGGPVRLIVPRLFAWKSAKWVKRITLSADNIPGYWEQLGYHNVGDPWQNQRYRDDSAWMAANE
ncbi:MAG TPA: sulfite oxidase-like oxidoreductase [Planctomycetes bacterium]|nr:sulfite oxidase-like oxidoreductase [Fuerstiella sp.]HIK91286.1 sulfite oxidase-like oxidoreductase [Planctomycetota bacterium]